MKIYKLKNSKTKSYTIATKHKKDRPLLHATKEGNKIVQKELRYATNMNTPYVEDQKGVAVDGVIEFVDGFLRVSDNDTPLINFLKVTPDNGRIFVEVNYEKDAEKELSKFELEDKAIEIYKDLSDNAIKTIYSRITEGRGKATSFIIMKNEVRKFLRKSPSEFIKISQGKDLLFRETVEKLFSDGILKKGRSSDDYSPIRFNIGEDNSIMCKVNKKGDYIDHVIEYLLSDEGKVNYDRLITNREQG